MDFLNWANGDPDYPDSNSQVFGIHVGAEMKDRPVGFAHLSLCQMGTGQIPLANDSPKRCAVPFVPLSQRCIYVNPTEAYRPDAADACSAMCAGCTLASVHNQDELNVIQTLVEAE